MKFILKLFQIVFSLNILFFSMQSWADEYVNVKQSSAVDSTRAPLFVIIAYAAIWLVVLGFAFYLWRRQNQIRDELRTARLEIKNLNQSKK